MPVKIDCADVSEVEWHSAHPTLVNTACPLVSEVELVVGAGGANNRANAAKLITCDERVEAVGGPLAVGRPCGGPRRLVESSGVALNTQPATADRSFGNASFDTPCSTLYASPEKISSDLFCAFQPNLVMVPSLPLPLNDPPMPS